MNRYLFEMANIRDQDSWVHQAQPEKATEKAKDLVCMALAKVALLEPVERLRIELKRAALVVGGGIAGMSAALNVADQGFETFLMERREKLGGNALNIKKTWKGEDVQDFLSSLSDRVLNHPGIEVLTGSQIENVNGFVGQFVTTVSANGRSRDLHHGVAILATGAKVLEPQEYLYGQNDRVKRWQELEQAIDQTPDCLEQAGCVAFIQCVGSRELGRPYCSKICCANSIRQAIELKQQKPDLDIYIFYRDIRAYGLRVDLYQKARAMGVFFICYSLDRKPVVEQAPDGSGRLIITAADHIS